jgi:hypothetical protein
MMMISLHTHQVYGDIIQMPQNQAANIKLGYVMHLQPVQNIRLLLNQPRDE